MSEFLVAFLVLVDFCKWLNRVFLVVVFRVCESLQIARCRCIPQLLQRRIDWGACSLQHQKQRPDFVLLYLISENPWEIGLLFPLSSWDSLKRPSVVFVGAKKKQQQKGKEEEESKQKNRNKEKRSFCEDKKKNRRRLVCRCEENGRGCWWDRHNPCQELLQQ